jgi:polyamine oxidase
MGRELNTSYHFYDSSGAEITNSKELQQRVKDWYAAEEKITDESIRRTKARLPDISVRRALEDNGWIPQSPVDSAIEWVGADFNLGYTPENTSLQMNYPDPTYTDFGVPSQIVDYFITDQKVGYIGVIQCLADRYLTNGDSRLHLRSVVKEIAWSNECVCAMTTESGSLRRYCAPYAILTFSVGVLKSKVVKFTPELPQAKQTAFDHAYDTLFLKIYLEFEETFWPTDANYIVHADEERGHFYHFQSLSQHFPPRQPSILLATVTGRWATAVYDQTPNTTQSQIMQVLRKLYGSQIPDPVGITIPDWGINPQFMGMYSDFPPGYGHLQADLVSPAGRLYFGGEATNSDYGGYLHGAYFSGIDVANQIVGMK